MVQPKQSDIAQAKEYLRRRLAAEVSMEHYLDRKLLAAARKIISLAYGRHIPPTLFSFEYDPFLAAEVTNIINALVDEIEEYNLLIATMTDREDKDALVPYIYREIDGATYRDRLNLYATKFKLELQHFIATQMMLGFSKTDTSQHIAAEYKHLKEGKGYASYPRLLTLTRHTIADAWMHADMEYHIRKGAIGFISRRASNYPCQLCDDMARVFHTFAEPYPPYHPHCVCIAIPIYQQQNL